MISIVIPVFNEEANVIPLFREIKEVMSTMQKPYEVIFINDGSQDNTLANLKDLLKNNEGKGVLRILDLRKNYGQTPALLAGLAHVNGEIVITMDGDLQNNPRDIPNLLEALTDDYDVICGWRKNRKDNLFKKIPSKFNNHLNRKLNSLHIHDSGCTLRIYRREAIENIQLFAESHRYLPAILAYQGFRIGEAVTNHRSREKGKTKYGFTRLFKGFIDLITLYYIHRWGKKPMYLFVRWACLFWLISASTFCWTILERVAFYRFWVSYSSSINIKTNPLFMISFGLFLIGVISIFLGFIAELLIRNQLNSHESYTIRKEWN